MKSRHAGVMHLHVLEDVATWLTKQQIDFTNYTHHAWMTPSRHQEEYCEIFGMLNFCVKFMDMQETDCSVTQQHQS